MTELMAIPLKSLVITLLVRLSCTLLIGTV